MQYLLECFNFGSGGSECGYGEGFSDGDWGGSVSTLLN